MIRVPSLLSIFCVLSTLLLTRYNTALPTRSAPHVCISGSTASSLMTLGFFFFFFAGDGKASPDKRMFFFRFITT